MELYKHQKKAVKVYPNKWGFWWETGTGKTLAAIKLVEKHNLIALTICPKSLKEQWIEQISKHHKSIIPWLVLTKEEFRKDWDKIYKVDCLVPDESHYFSGVKSQMHKSLIKYIKKHNPTHIYPLTATPYLSTPWNVYALAKILGHNWNYMQFKNRFFEDQYFGGRAVSVPKKDIEEELAYLLTQIGSTVALQDCIDIPEQIYQTETFELTTEQKRAIKIVEEIETAHISKWTKIHQIMGGSLKGDGYTETQTFKCNKLNRLKDLCKEHKKVVVVCRYNAEVEMIFKELEDKKSIWQLTGSNSEYRNEMTKEANKEDECIVIVNAACSEGYELPTFDLMVFYSYDFSLKNYIQMKGRIQRINHVKKNVYLSLINKGTIDEDVKKSLDKKVDFDIALYDK